MIEDSGILIFFVTVATVLLSIIVWPRAGQMEDKNQVF